MAALDQTGNRFFKDVINKNSELTTSSEFVVPPGIEPGTQGFSVLCSTN
jgi:hypothetical protein